MGLVTVSSEERERERMSYMVLRVADEVSMAICLRAFARAAVS